MTTPEEFAAEAEILAKEIRAEEERARKIALGIEQRKKALLERGERHYAAQLASCREQALASLGRARDALAKLGPAPAQPRLDGITDPIAYADQCEAHGAAVEAHSAGVKQISFRAHRECQALDRLAGNARREAREMGIVASPQIDGVGIVPEHVRRHARLRLRVDQWGLNYVDMAPIYSLDMIDGLIEALSEPVPQPQSPNPDYPAGVQRAPEKDAGWIARGWALLSRLGRDDEQPRDQRSETLRDADRVMQRTPEEQRLAAERQAGIRP